MNHYCYNQRLTTGKNSGPCFSNSYRSKTMPQQKSGFSRYTLKHNTTYCLILQVSTEAFYLQSKTINGMTNQSAKTWYNKFNNIKHNPVLRSETLSTCNKEQAQQKQHDHSQLINKTYKVQHSCHNNSGNTIVGYAKARTTQAVIIQSTCLTISTQAVRAYNLISS